MGRNQLIHAIDYALFFTWGWRDAGPFRLARDPVGLWRFQNLAGQLKGELKSKNLAFALGWKLPLAVAVLVEST